MARKFIINDYKYGNEIVMGGGIDYHIELLGKERTKEKTIGGGMWEWNQENKIVYFFGSSLEFGKVTKEQFSEAFQNSLISPYMDDCVFFFSEEETIEGVLNDKNKIKVIPNK